MIHITKRKEMPLWQSLAVRLGAIVIALVVCGFITTITTGLNPIDVYATMIKGAFGTARKTWSLLQELAILLCISVALTPAFRMKFWNLGGEGQILIGCFASAACMILLGDKVPNVLLIIIMLIAWLASHSSVHYSHYTTREHTTVTHTPNGTITVTTSGNMSDAQADSMMQAAMAEMQQTDSAMQAMMNSMMGGADPFASEIEGEMPSRHMAQQHHASTPTMPTLAGHIGKREFVMVLNLKDPQNVKGSGSYVANGKEQGKLHLLGIQDGEALTVSIYGKGNKLQGTLSGSYDGIQYQGSYQVDGKETPFDLYVR